MTSYTVDATNEAASGVSVSVAVVAASNIAGAPSSDVPVFVPSDQLYYWGYAWRDAERKAKEDLRAGRSRTFDDPVAAVHYLLGSDR